MTFGEALSKAVGGYKVRHFGMANGQFVHYDFDGFLISGKPFRWTDADTRADWYCVDAIVPTGANWDVGAAVEEIDKPIFVPSCWDLEPIFITKPDTVKAGWEMFDRAKRGK